jgi:hypothetical protein
MIAELLGAAQSVQALSTLLGAANGLANYNEIVAAVSEVNTKLMQANAVALSSQEKQSTLTAKVHELEQEVMSLKNWDSEKQKYELKEIARGVFARTEHGYVGALQSAHKFCATCFEKNIKSPLQQENVTELRQLSLTCHTCKAKIIFRHYSDVQTI